MYHYNSWLCKLFQWIQQFLLLHIYMVTLSKLMFYPYTKKFLNKNPSYISTINTKISVNMNYSVTRYKHIVGFTKMSALGLKLAHHAPVIGSHRSASHPNGSSHWERQWGYCWNELVPGIDCIRQLGLATNHSLQSLGFVC